MRIIRSWVARSAKGVVKLDNATPFADSGPATHVSETVFKASTPAQIGAVQRHHVRAASIPSGLFCAILSLIPIAYALRGFSWEYGFLRLPRFGEVFRDRALPAVRQYAPPPKPKDIGYDGQFYAQIALDPTLRDPALANACDSLSYRAQRIFLPSLAYLLGAGEPWWVLQIYAIINLPFWFLLFFVLKRQFGIETWRARALLISCLWTAGVLVSIGRALTDLPALCLAIIAISASQATLRQGNTKGDWLRGTKRWSSLFASLSVLTKETAVLSFLGEIGQSIRRDRIRGIGLGAIVILPTAWWFLYLRYRLGVDTTGLGNFHFPLYGFVHKLLESWREAWLSFPRLPLLELIAPWSIAVQVFFLVRYPAWRSPWWRFGIGFAVLATVIGPWVWSTQTAYSRCLLPLTCSFNIQLFSSEFRSSRYWGWYFFGNIGLMDRASFGLLGLGLLMALLAIGWRPRRLSRQASESV